MWSFSPFILPPGSCKGNKYFIPGSCGSSRHPSGDQTHRRNDSRSLFSSCGSWRWRHSCGSFWCANSCNQIRRRHGSCLGSRATRIWRFKSCRTFVSAAAFTFSFSLLALLSERLFVGWRRPPMSSDRRNRRFGNPIIFFFRVRNVDGDVFVFDDFSLDVSARLVFVFGRKTDYDRRSQMTRLDVTDDLDVAVFVDFSVADFVVRRNDEMRRRVGHTSTRRRHLIDHKRSMIRIWRNLIESWR